MAVEVSAMGNFYNAGDLSDVRQKDHRSCTIENLMNSSKRKLRTLRALLILWALSFGIVLFWFTLSNP